ncbi:Lrp/AsnC family transcriptional regulator [Rarobacter incanus]|uniref:Lrp/AsnC family leucine-responsive transcriptional regulator n=1 Tax=Rarobacter incanus TaxID=153494 RepID=A0A542SPC5_9MICO|nr:Lrp/AsnC family transcriptional regulator [Rarobacter incanus]TQK76470.1 Lrp/AsnC family leucine-responsive transcriptional regulator [Rarobacter incanus]
MNERPISTGKLSRVPQSEVIDQVDRAIIEVLTADGRATLAKLSDKTGLSVSAVQSRVQKLERRGIIAGYRAVVDHEALGTPISAFVSVTPLDYSQQSQIPARLAEIAGVMSCYSIAGAPSYMLLVRTQSPSHLEDLLNTIHASVPVSTQTTLILQAYFEE